MDWDLSGLRLLLGAAVAGGLLTAVPTAPAFAQPAGAAMPDGFGTSPPNNTMALNAALVRLGQNPRDLGALLDAGSAAMAIGDIDAAIGFFTRADQLSPGNPRVKAGLASALVHNGNPFDAIPMFAEAERDGGLDSKAELDRGLAYDLVADNASAQRYYRQAMAAGPSDEALRRLSLSLAIAGDRRASEAVIKPLLDRQDKAAWRSRAFSLAIMGKPDEAISIVKETLPADLANAIAPYMRYMPRLTPAQQAAAANFGQFPRASEIGQDDPRVASFATNTRRAALATADAALVPRGEPLGQRNGSRESREAKRERQERERQAVIEQREAREKSQREAREQRDAQRRAEQQRQRQLAEAQAAERRNRSTPLEPPVEQSVRPLLSASGVATPLPERPMAPPAGPTPAPTSVAANVPPPSMPEPVRPVAPATTPVAAPVWTLPPPAPPPSPPPAPHRRVADVFGDISLPTTDSSPAAGAVDIRRIKPARIESGPAGSKTASGRPAPPLHPSRIWVQVATGRDKNALGFDWRRMTRANEAVFRGKKPYISAWGQATRLLTGPFESEAAANTFINQLHRADIDAFVWTSPAGQVVDAVPPK